ncbi:transposase [Streptomyces canus]|uniref:IS110 family transposase n=1 Tax=Streptomyces canus TaxID=58343 RepID=UPI003865B9AD
MLLDHDQPVHYISGRAIHRASESYRGEGRTEAKDAAVMADQVRIRGDLHPLRAGDGTVTDLKILTGRRTDLVADRTRAVNRLRAQLTSVLPGLERALDLTSPGLLVLLTGHQTPAAIHRIGAKGRETWLCNRHVLRADQLARTALHTPAKGAMALNQLVAELDKVIEARFRERHLRRDHQPARPGRHRRRSLPESQGTGARDQWQPPTATAAIQPSPPTRLLHLGVVQHPTLRGIASVLRSQTRRGQAPHPGRPRSCPPPCESVSPAAQLAMRTNSPRCPEP